MAHRVFKDRLSAGSLLGLEIAKLDLTAAVVLGLPRGGVPVAAEVARAISAPLDVIVVRKLGVPHQPELAMGAIGEDGIVVINDDVLRMARVSDDELEVVSERERDTLDRSVKTLRTLRPRLSLSGRSALIVDDGIATGATMRAAIGVARANDVRAVIVATPVAPDDVVEDLRSEADEVICPVQPHQFGSVGRWYRRFEAVSDDEVVDLLIASMVRIAD